MAPKKTKNSPQSDSGHNITWDLNHTIIRDSYVKLIRTTKRKPTFAEVSKDCKLSIPTIQKHLHTLVFELRKHPLRILTDDVLLAIVNSARKGSTGSQKLWMQLTEGWSEKTITEYEGLEKIGEIILTTRSKTNDKP